MGFKGQVSKTNCSNLDDPKQCLVKGWNRDIAIDGHARKIFYMHYISVIIYLYATNQCFLQRCFANYNYIPDMMSTGIIFQLLNSTWILHSYGSFGNTGVVRDRPGEEFFEGTARNCQVAHKALSRQCLVRTSCGEAVEAGADSCGNVETTQKTATNRWRLFLKTCLQNQTTKCQREKIYIGDRDAAYWPITCEH